MIDRIAAVLRKEVGILGRQVTPDTSIRGDLSATSIDLICMSVGIEEEFGFEVGDDELASWETVADILALVERKMEAA